MVPFIDLKVLASVSQQVIMISPWKISGWHHSDLVYIFIESRVCSHTSYRCGRWGEVGPQVDHLYVMFCFHEGCTHVSFTKASGSWKSFMLLFLLPLFPHPAPLPVTLQMLYKLKTSKVFEKPKAGEGRGVELADEDPYAVQMISWCPQSRLFCVVGSSAHVILYHFSRHDATTEITVSGSSTPRDAYSVTIAGSRNQAQTRGCSENSRLYSQKSPKTR